VARYSFYSQIWTSSGALDGSHTMDDRGPSAEMAAETEIQEVNELQRLPPGVIHDILLCGTWGFCSPLPFWRNKITLRIGIKLELKTGNV